MSRGRSAEPVLFWIVMTLRAVVLVLFGLLVTRAVTLRPRMGSADARGLLAFLAVAATAFMLASLEGIVAGVVVGDGAWDGLYGWLELALVTLLGALAAGGLYALQRFSHGLDRRLTALDMLSREGDFEVPELDLSELTPRERELVRLMVSGATSDEELARELSIASATAATHVRNILRKTGLSSRRQLVVAMAATMGRNDHA